MSLILNSAFLFKSARVSQDETVFRRSVLRAMGHERDGISVFEACWLLGVTLASMGFVFLVCWASTHIARPDEYSSLPGCPPGVETSQTFEASPGEDSIFFSFKSGTRCVKR